MKPRHAADRRRRRIVETKSTEQSRSEGAENANGGRWRRSEVANGLKEERGEARLHGGGTTKQGRKQSTKTEVEEGANGHQKKPASPWTSWGRRHLHVRRGVGAAAEEKYRVNPSRVKWQCYMTEFKAFNDGTWYLVTSYATLYIYHWKAIKIWNG